MRAEAPPSAYIDWLRAQGGDVRTAAGTYWRYVRGAILPALPFPVFAVPSPKEERTLLAELRGLFVRSTPAVPENVETTFWYVVCDRYDQTDLSRNMRNQIRRGVRSCTVSRLDARWLAENGHDCCAAAAARYEGTTPPSENAFRKGALAMGSGPYEMWGVFTEGRLVGYCHCIVEEGKVALSTFAIDPSAFPAYPAYALLDAILSDYVAGRGFSVSNGTRPVVHDTNFQDFLLKFGFRRIFCGLRLAYAPSAAIAVRLLFPFRSLLPENGRFASVRSVLLQEEIARSTRRLVGAP